MDLMIPEYQGPMRTGFMEPVAARAFHIYKAQVRRCSNPKDKDFKTYGARGIEVRYSPRKFIQWYLNHFRHFKGIGPTVGRVDHANHYSFDNIEMISNRLNVAERLRRCGPAVLKKRVLAYKNSGEFVGVFDSATSAAAATGASHHTISSCCLHGWTMGHSGYFFRYE